MMSGHGWAAQQAFSLLPGQPDYPSFAGQPREELTWSTPPYAPPPPSTATMGPPYIAPLIQDPHYAYPSSSGAMQPPPPPPSLVTTPANYSSLYGLFQAGNLTQDQLNLLLRLPDSASPQQQPQGAMAPGHPSSTSAIPFSAQQWGLPLMPPSSSMPAMSSMAYPSPQTPARFVPTSATQQLADVAHYPAPSYTPTPMQSTSLPSQSFFANGPASMLPPGLRASLAAKASVSARQQGWSAPLASTSGSSVGKPGSPTSCSPSSATVQRAASGDTKRGTTLAKKRRSAGVALSDGGGLGLDKTLRAPKASPSASSPESTTSSSSQAAAPGVVVGLSLSHSRLTPPASRSGSPGFAASGKPKCATQILAEGSPGMPSLAQLQAVLKPDAFKASLSVVMGRKNMVIKEPYVIEGKHVPLFNLYQAVMVHGGGVEQVDADQAWDRIALHLHLPISNGFPAKLARLYHDVLATYENIWATALLKQREKFSTALQSPMTAAPSCTASTSPQVARVQEPSSSDRIANGPVTGMRRSRAESRGPIKPFGSQRASKSGGHGRVSSSSSVSSFDGVTHFEDLVGAEDPFNSGSDSHCPSGTMRSTLGSNGKKRAREDEPTFVKVDTTAPAAIQAPVEPIFDLTPPTPIDPVQFSALTSTATPYNYSFDPMPSNGAGFGGLCSDYDFGASSFDSNVSSGISPSRFGMSPAPAAAKSLFTPPSEDDEAWVTKLQGSDVDAGFDLDWDPDAPSLSTFPAHDATSFGTDAGQSWM